LKRLENLSEVLFDPATPWQPVTVPGWYGGIEGSTNTAACRYGGMSIVPIRWIRAGDPNSRFEAQALLCTDLAQAPSSSSANLSSAGRSASRCHAA
jgi:hypothetical protein